MDNQETQTAPMASGPSSTVVLERGSMTYDDWLFKHFVGQELPTKGADILARAAWEEATKIEREECAKVCDAEADRMEQGAQDAINNGEHDEVSAIRSAAWKLSVAANRIRARSNYK